MNKLRQFGGAETVEQIARRRARESQENMTEPPSTEGGTWGRRRQPERSPGSPPTQAGCGVDRSQHVPSRDQEETGCSKPRSGVTNSVYQVSVTDLG